MKTVFLLIDIQQDFWEPFKAQPEYIQLPDNITKLRSYSTENNIPVIHINSIFNPNREDWMLFYRPEGRGTIPCIKDTPGSMFTEFAQPLEHEKVFTKQVFDAVTGTKLHEYLAEQEIDTVIIAGIETSVCVLFTATSLYLNRFLPIVVSDACADTPERHTKTLEMYTDLCYKTLTTAQILDGQKLHQLKKTFTEPK